MKRPKHPLDIDILAIIERASDNDSALLSAAGNPLDQEIVVHVRNCMWCQRRLGRMALRLEEEPGERI